MNIYDLIKEHKSVRNYQDTPVADTDLRMILEAAIKAPSSINGQQWSVIVVKDAELRQKLSVLSGNQPYIAKAPIFLVFVMDYNRIATSMKKLDLVFEHAKSMEAIMVGCVDVGLAFSNAMNVAESLGYGTVAIGGIRSNADQVAELLDLPQYVYPILGMCLGLPASEHQIKPRLPYEAMIFENKYNLDMRKVEEYDEEIKSYLSSRQTSNRVSTWTESVAKFYQKIYAPKAKEFLKKQGFSDEI